MALPGTKKRKLMDEFRAGLFREKIVPELPVERMIPKKVSLDCLIGIGY